MAVSFWNCALFWLWWTMSSVLFRISKAFRGFRRCQRVTCVCFMQLCIVTWYMTSYNDSHGVEQYKLSQTSVDSAFAKRISGNLHFVEKRKHTSTKSIKLIRKDVHSDDVIVKRAVNNDENDRPNNCDMETYLTNGEDQCIDLLGLAKPSDSDETPSISTQYVKDSSCDVTRIHGNCDVIRASYLYGKDSLTEEEIQFPLAFAMKIHGFPNQAHRLLRYIYTPHNVYCIHVDKKAADDVYNAFRRLKRCFDNVILIEDRVDVVYSSIRQIEAEMRCLSAMKQSRVKWKYYVNLTGQEFMLKTNLELVRYLNSLNGSNDIESNPMPGEMFHRFKQKAFINEKGRIVISKARKNPFRSDVKLRKGSAYGMFSRDFVNYLLNHPLVKQFIDWLKDTYAPEETIWATLNAVTGAPGGDPGRRTYHDGKYRARAVKWQTDKTQKCHGKYVHWVCVYGVGDLPDLLNNRNMVANKFYEHFEPLALDCLEAEMYQRLVHGDS